MKYYLAPMEGLTGYIYRNAYERFFNNNSNINKYFTPFIVPTKGKKLKTRELRDISPENNEGMNIVPQILTNDSEGFIFTCEKLKQLGYNEVNLNLGCPAGTIVSKNRGSGFLSKREELDRFLDEIFKIKDIRISIKTRIGKDSPEEFYEIIKIYNKYPMSELIIHPRTQKDFYGNKPNLDVFKDALNLSKNTVCYNGDIFTVKDHDKLLKQFPNLNSIMIGRGILANPGLMNEIKNKVYMDKNTLREFHEEILYKHIEVFKEEKNAIFRMKELWGYMIYMFSNNKKYAKQIKKSQKLNDYNNAVMSLFAEQEITKGSGLFNNLY